MSSKNISLDVLKKREKEISEEILTIDSQKRDKLLELAIVKEAINQLTIQQNKTAVPQFAPKISIPAEYDNTLRWEDRIAWVLNKKGKATVREITQEIVKQEKMDESDYEVTYKKIQQVILRMLKELKVEKLGSYNSKYKLNIKEG